MEILYQDKRILVAIKPSGVLSTDEAGGMPSLLRAQLGGENTCIRTVHRLDAAVGGLMVFARSAKAASLLGSAMQQRRFHKEYLAVVHGAPPEEGTLRDLLRRDPARRITLVADAPSQDTREAALSYRVVQRQGQFSLVRITLHTGRTHQIRVQFASRGYPLAGDRKYGLQDSISPIALWSCRLSFPHPETNETVTFVQAPPTVPPWDQFLDLEESLT